MESSRLWRSIDRARSNLAAQSEIPLVRRFLARRVVAAEPAAGLAAVVPLLKTSDDAACRDLLTGAREALRGRKHIASPQSWAEAFAELVSRRDSEGDRGSTFPGARPRRAEGHRRAQADRAGSGDPAEERSRALAALVERRVPRLARDLQALTGDRALRGLALRSLAAYDDPATPEVILKHYGEYSSAEREDAIATLAARPGVGEVRCWSALGRGQISRRDVSVSIARQLQAFGDRGIERAT